MPEFRVRLERPVPAVLIPEVARRIHFVSDSILGYKFVHRDDRLIEVVLTFGPGAAADEVGGMVDRMIAAEVEGQLPLPARRIWTSAVSPGAQASSFDDLEDRGLVVGLGEGRVVIARRVIELIAHLDRKLAAIARTELGAQEYQYPTLLPTSVLRRTGYLRSFPQHLMLVTRLPADFDTYRGFSAQPGDVAQDGSVLAACDNEDYCLPPTMCYHTFSQYADSTVPSGRFCVTSQGKSFRHESRYARSMERLWDFTIREIVFFGSQAEVTSGRARLLAAAGDLVDQLGLTGHCEVANDSFFAGSDTADQASSQRLMELKYELRLAIAGGSTVAAGSFNDHGSFFTEAFGIRASDGPLSSGCAGFGLERLAYAFLCQHGPEPAGWPDPVAAAVLAAEDGNA